MLRGVDGNCPSAPGSNDDDHGMGGLPRRITDHRTSSAQTVTRQERAIRYCGDAYRVVTGDRRTHTFWEFNLRFKTDGSASGPSAGKPVIVGTGMQGDRAAVVFSRPEEISEFIRKECP